MFAAQIKSSSPLFNEWADNEEGNRAGHVQADILSQTLTQSLAELLRNENYSLTKLHQSANVKFSTSLSVLKEWLPPVIGPLPVTGDGVGLEPDSSSGPRIPQIGFAIYNGPILALPACML